MCVICLRMCTCVERTHEISRQFVIRVHSLSLFRQPKERRSFYAVEHDIGDGSSLEFPKESQGRPLAGLEIDWRVPSNLVLFALWWHSIPLLLIDTKHFCVAYVISFRKIS